ncbi:MAG: AbrB/MazE/SpoVT family DNA-binding domain-containing protein [Anaerolineales bacterium]|nr:AbrB/MazE/SpoVT family DNA-binding domain-containing protein [Anaerolineales bacterium]
MTVQTTLVQAKGQVTIPLEIRKRLKLKQGDRVAFIETKDGVIIQPAEVVVSAALSEIGERLDAEGVSLEQLIERGRKIREELVEEEYGLGDDGAE